MSASVNSVIKDITSVFVFSHLMVEISNQNPVISQADKDEKKLFQYNPILPTLANCHVWPGN